MCHRKRDQIFRSAVDINVDGDAAVLGELGTIGGLELLIVEALDLDVAVDAPIGTVGDRNATLQDNRSRGLAI